MAPVLHRRALLAAGAGAMLAAPTRAASGAPVRIGEVNSYTAQPAFLKPYRQGWELAQERVNAAGGVLGRPVETLFRDDGGKPEDAVRLAGELLDSDRVDALAGGFLSNIGLALAEVAARRKRLYLATEPLTDALVWAKGNRYTFRLRPSTYMQASMLAGPAAKLSATRWATVAPNYEYGQSAVRWFKELLQRARPDVTFVAEQFPALGRIDAGATVQALEAAKPDAIFNVTFAADLANFVRQGNTRGLFEGRSVASMLTGEPEYLLPLGAEAPEGWIVTGYPVEQIATPAHAAFRDTYKARWGEEPRLGSVVGYAGFDALARAFARAGETGSEALVGAFEGLSLPSPFGEITFRALDHQSTMGAYLGRLAGGRMTGFTYEDGAAHLPPDDVVRGLRPGG